MFYEDKREHYGGALVLFKRNLAVAVPNAMYPVTAFETECVVLLKENFWLIVILERIRDENEDRAEWIG